MKETAALQVVQELMMEFARETGLFPPGRLPRRYLWTDAFAVCNFLGLYRRLGEEKYLQLAVSLVDQVHNTLGRHRDDDSRRGWLSGLKEEEGRAHPTAGGLRIGKRLNERRPVDPFDERLEWDRDGQYFHYLTKWMNALNRVSIVTGNPDYNRWAAELAKKVHSAFLYQPPGNTRKRMYWKMSIDLSYPLVPSMGHHDPLDGLITYSQISTSAAAAPGNPETPDLSREIDDMVRICRGKDWDTDDPLGIGGLLADAYKVAQLMAAGGFSDSNLLPVMLGSALHGLRMYVRGDALRLPADYRLAFRELGLSIGLRAVDRLERRMAANPHVPGTGFSEPALRRILEDFGPHAALAGRIEGFWLEKTHRERDSWTEHEDINGVMLATSLAPDGYLELS